MVGTAREHSQSCVYYVVLRGSSRRDICFDDEDRLRFLEILAQKKSDGRFEVLGYCLMGKHVHLLIREAGDSISRIMSRIGTSYAR